MRFTCFVFLLLISTVCFSNDDPVSDFVLSSFDSETTTITQGNTVTITTVIKNDTFNSLSKILINSLLLLAIFIVFLLTWGFWMFFVKTIEFILLKIFDNKTSKINNST